jgi:arylsulfatase A-like enzyme
MVDESKKRFNVIAVVLDGVRFDRIKLLPNFRKLCNKGTLFSNMITYAPYTIASLHSIFTGAYGSENGVDNYYGSLSYKQKEFKTITEYLKEQDYFTFGDLINEVVTPRQGFSKLVLQGEDYDFCGEHKKMLNEAKSVNKDNKSFFLFLHYSPVHNSLVKNVIKQFTDFDKKYFENKEGNLKKYDSYIKKADKYLESIYNEIKKLNLFENSLIVFFSDHGSSIGEKIGERVYGSFCYDHTIKIFALFISPKGFPVKNVNKVTRGIDIMPTILDIFGIDGEFSNKINGKSLMPLISDEEKEGRIAFSETGGLFGPYPSPKKPNVKAIRTQNWKLIYNLTPNTKELYNLVDDPFEINNLAGKGFQEEKKLWGILKSKSQIDLIPPRI